MTLIVVAIKMNNIKEQIAIKNANYKTENAV